MDLFGKLQHPSTLAFLRAYPTLQTARAASVEDLATLRKRSRFPGARKKAEELVNHLKPPSLMAKAVITRAKSRLMLALIAQLEPLLTQIEEYDKEIERLFLSHEDLELFQSLPGAGARLAPRRFSEMGDDRDRYASAGSLQALAGPSPVLYQSGTYQKAHRRLGCLKPWRNALFQFADRSRRWEAWAGEYSQRKRAEGKSHTVAVRALANRWARILFAIWKTRQMYCSATFEAAQRTHALRIA